MPVLRADVERLKRENCVLLGQVESLRKSRDDIVIA